jgi:peptidoglycan hydrolase CwlO-like protein
MRRPGRPRVSVGRSSGEAEHHVRTGLTRLNLTRLVAGACIATLGLLPAVPAHASTTGDRIAATKNAIEVAAQRWFAAQADVARIDASIADVEHQIKAAQANIEQARKIATARVVVMYKNADLGLASMFGDNALDSARRAHLVDNANAGGDAAIAKLTAAVDDLHAQRRSLEAARSQQQKVARLVSTERRALDAELESVRALARHDARVALAAARNQVARSRATVRIRALSAAHPTDALAAPTGPPVRVAQSLVIVAAPRADTRVSPHHDDPFLACTRARESGGRYDAISPSGYYGAYQFLPSTWDSTAVHAGRLDLVGELPSRASPYDQDETAWALYQWQGAGPWGGRC